MSIRSMHPKIGVFQTIFYTFISEYLKIVILDSKSLIYKHPGH